LFRQFSGKTYRLATIHASQTTDRRQTEACDINDFNGRLKIMKTADVWWYDCRISCADYDATSKGDAMCKVSGRKPSDRKPTTIGLLQ